MKNSPWAKLMTRMTPKMRTRPTAINATKLLCIRAFTSV